MASKGKDVSYVNKSSDFSLRKRTPRSSIADSSDSDSSSIILTEKPIPNYLKPTKSSGLELCYHGKKQVSEDTNQKHTFRRSFDKPPSQSHLQRVKSANPRERSLKPSSSSSPKTFNSSKPISDRALPRTATYSKSVSDRTSKTPRVGKPQPILLSKPRSTRKGKNNIFRKESKATIVPTTPSIAETTEINSDRDDKESSVQDVEEEEEEAKTVESEKEILVYIQVAHVQTPIDHKDSETKILEDEKSEEPKPALVPHVEKRPEAKIDEQLNDDNDHEDKNNHDGDNDKEDNQDKKECSKNIIEESLAGEHQDKGKADCVVGTGHENNKPYKLKFKQGKELEKKKEEDGGSKRLKFKKRGDHVEVEGNNEEGEPDQKESIVVLKHQDVQTKQTSQAYNDVIEETVTKLNEKGKSKVKGLVGAFETVISLQEHEEQI